ncbi:MAG TPA: hypothetical protein VLF93_02230 [Candidatus Saccharimonadales bacterium]|nr:hypothetical protein [Candidatus Saccharimonadales bacterium]
MEAKTNSTQSPYVKSSSQQSSASPVMRPMETHKNEVGGSKVVLVLFLMLLVGAGLGYGASYFSKATGASIVPSALNPNAPQKGKVYGTGDTSIFKDTAEGQMQNGGIDGEGQYHLVRPGGPSQSVYLTSSSVDLSQFVGQKIKVWGQTQAAQHAGWLMDVGKVEVE